MITKRTSHHRRIGACDVDRPVDLETTLGTNPRCRRATSSCQSGAAVRGRFVMSAKAEAIVQRGLDVIDPLREDPATKTRSSRRGGR